MEARQISLCLVVVFALSGIAFADVIELKSGQRVEGNFKTAGPEGVVVEIGQQLITFKLDQVRAIYLGTLPEPSVTSAHSMSEDALEALKALRSVTQVGTTQPDYNTRFLDTKIKVDRYLESAVPNDAAIKLEVSHALECYGLAKTAWDQRPLRDRSLKGVSLQALYDNFQLTCVDCAPRFREFLKTTQNRIELEFGFLPAIWSDAAAHIAAAEALPPKK